MTWAGCPVTSSRHLSLHHSAKKIWREPRIHSSSKKWYGHSGVKYRMGKLIVRIVWKPQVKDKKLLKTGLSKGNSSVFFHLSFQHGIEKFWNISLLSFWNNFFYFKMIFLKITDTYFKEKVNRFLNFKIKMQRRVFFP